MIRSLTRPSGWPMRADQVLVAAGFPSGRCPPEGFEMRKVGDTTVWADALVKGARFRLRVVCACPRCGKMGIPAGRLRQHQGGRTCRAVGESV